MLSVFQGCLRQGGRRASPSEHAGNRERFHSLPAKSANNIGQSENICGNGERAYSFSTRLAKCRKQLQDAASRVSAMHAKSVGRIEWAGRGLVRQKPAQAPAVEDGRGSRFMPRDVEPIDQSLVPVVEAACLFGRGVIRRGVAAFALAEFGQPRSMHVLAKSLNMGSMGASNPAALALVDYGEKGAELASQVPLTKPGEHDTGLAMTRHRGGTSVLAENKDIRGIDQILAGLDTLNEDRTLDRWDHRMRIYLRAASQFHDKRLVDPLLDILANDYSRYRAHRKTTIELLSAYEDKRMVPLFAECLNTFPPDSLYRVYGAALTGLTRCLGKDTPEYMVGLAKKAPDDRIRAGALFALGELSYPTAPPHPGKRRWSADRFDTPESRARMARKVRELGFSVLVEATKAPSETINHAAAKGLTVFAAGSKYDRISPDIRAVGPLTDWCATNSTIFHHLARFLADHGNEETGKALLGVLKAQPPTQGNGFIVWVLGKLKPAGTVPVFVRNIKACEAEAEGRHNAAFTPCGELSALPNFETEGADALRQIASESNNFAHRFRAAYLLGKTGKEKTIPLLVECLDEFVTAGPQNPNLRVSVTSNRVGAYMDGCRVLLAALAEVDLATAQEQAKIILLNGPNQLEKLAVEVLAPKRLSPIQNNTGSL